MHFISALENITNLH